jgi:hypothetical protein
MFEPGRTFVTPQQAVVHAMFLKHRSLSVVARHLQISQIRVREALVQHERNRMRDAGIAPAPLREMLKGDVTTRFGVPRKEFGGRPAKHARVYALEPCERYGGSETMSRLKSLAVPSAGIRRLLITAVEAGGRVHSGFWLNLKAYAVACDAELVVTRIGAASATFHCQDDYEAFVATTPFGLAGLLDVALDERPHVRVSRPLDGTRHRSSATWTIIPHSAIQFETLPRMRAVGYRGQLTTGAMTVPRAMAPPWRRELGAVVVDIAAGGVVHCRHILASTDGDGTIHDLDTQVSAGVVRRGCRVEALTFGDIHHAHLDPAVAAATWGLGNEGNGAAASLVDRLRPRHMIFHDVCDFDARSHHDRRDHHRRFAQMALGSGDVAAELTASAEFLAATRRDWAQSIVVGSNHDGHIVRWLRESDFREDPTNAIFFLEASLQLHNRLALGQSSDGIFEATLRRLSVDGLAGVRFLRIGESLRIAGIETGIHGHVGADGRQGDIRFFERLAVKATLGHTHRPGTRDGIYYSGVCQTDLTYARGPITNWAIGHVVTYPTGARQHLIFIDGAFHG